ncbi:hypothetical protein AB0H51_22095 [Streptomyces griseoluteus]|uniref:hypothetical protein n=1 Tax=Streptomyces griseoluteus TaxID=29306 RepID=UPI0033CA8565
MSGQQTTEKSFFEKAAYIVTPGSVVFALLYYFGYTYRSAYYAHFGLGVGDLGFTPQDYLLGSPAAVFLPLWMLLVLGIIGVLAFRALERWLSHPDGAERRGPVIRVLGALGVSLLLLSFPVFLEPTWWRTMMWFLLPVGWLRVLLPAVLVAVGGLLVLCAMYLTRDPQRRGGRFWGITEGLLVSATTLIVFFALARYAHGAGTSAAREEAENNFRDTTQVLIHSRQPIVPTAPNVQCTDQGAAHLPYRYQCTGFRVLAKSSTRYYLVPSVHQAGWDLILVLNDDNSIRVEVRGED